MLRLSLSLGVVVAIIAAGWHVERSRILRDQAALRQAIVQPAPGGAPIQTRPAEPLAPPSQRGC